MQHLDRTQLLALLSEAQKHDVRHHVLLLVSYWHGLRASEAVGLTTENIRDGYITVNRLKRSLATTHKLIQDSNPLLDERTLVTEYMKGIAPGGRLFSFNRKEFWRVMHRYGRLAGIPEHLCHPHVLKHSICMHSIKKAGIENVRQYVGHKSVSSTGFYLRVDDDQAADAIIAATHEGDLPARVDDAERIAVRVAEILSRQGTKTPTT